MMDSTTSREIFCLPFHFPGISHVRACFTSRAGGVSKGSFASANISFGLGDEDRAVRHNRRQLCRQLGLSNILELKQVHGLKIHFFQGIPTSTDLLEGDALATDQPGLPLLIKVADCQPVLITHRTKKLIAALHVGWRANRNQAIIVWIEKICKYYQVLPNDLSAVRGPSLGPGKAEFINFDQEWGPAFVPYFTSQHRTMDLWQLTKDQLKQAGLHEKNIFGLDLCTASNPELFFSYRRSKICGRQGGLIWITD